MLTVTSASGTSSADLKGETGETGPAGPRVPGLFRTTKAIRDGIPTYETVAKGSRIVGDCYINGLSRLGRVESVASAGDTADTACIEFVADLHGQNLFTCTGVTLEPGQTSASEVKVMGIDIAPGDLAVSTDTLRLCKVTELSVGYETYTWCYVQCLCILGGGAEYTFADPLSVDSDNEVSIDLSGYATKDYVDDAIAALDDLSEVMF